MDRAKVIAAALSLALIGCLVQSLPAFAAASAATGSSDPPVFVDREGVAIRGYDPVAYFEDGRPVEGSEEWMLRWRGAAWHFASRAHREAFREDPERYAPQYGGFCAYAMSQGKKASIDPESWDIVDGRLFLNYSPRVRRSWLEDRDERIRSADRHWAALVEEEE